MIYKLQPFLAHRLWGGNKLPQAFKAKINNQIGEAWCMSCIENKDCYICEGKTLRQLFLENKEIVAKGWNKDFPILIKLIDAQDNLSIQVHPSIKTEFWHVLNEQPSTLYMGFKKDSSAQEVANILNNGDITQYLNKVDVKAGDSYLINPGTIHAINGGTFLIEIQQSADCTYRLYDYHRKDVDGNERPLHIDKALECIDYKQYKFIKGDNAGHLVSTPFFNVYKYVITTDKQFAADEKSFHAITVIDGEGLIRTVNQEMIVAKYDTIFIPANEGEYKIDGNLTIIQTTL